MCRQIFLPELLYGRSSPQTLGSTSTLAVVPFRLPFSCHVHVVTRLSLRGVEGGGGSIPQVDGANAPACGNNEIGPSVRRFAGKPVGNSRKEKKRKKRQQPRALPLFIKAMIGPYEPVVPGLNPRQTDPPPPNLTPLSSGPLLTLPPPPTRVCRAVVVELHQGQLSGLQPGAGRRPGGGLVQLCSHQP